MTSKSATSNARQKKQPLLANDNNSKKLLFRQSEKVWQGGNSITDGSGAGGDDFKFSVLLALNLGLTPNNISISGGGIRDMVLKSFLNLPATGVIDPFILEGGLNDIRKAGANPKTYSKIVCGIRAMFFRHNLKLAVAASDASVTATGTWTNVATSGANTIGTCSDLSLGGTAKKSIVSGSTLAWTFTGNRLVIGTLVTDEVIENSGTFTIDIDGTSYGTYDGRGKTDGETGYLTVDGGTPNGVAIPADLLPNNNAITHDVWYVDNLGAGSHTVTITTTSTTKTYIDYFGTWLEHLDLNPLLIYEIPRMNATGYASSTSYNDNYVIDTANKLSIKVITEELANKNLPVASAPINDFYDPKNHAYADGIHPNGVGHKDYVDCGLSKIENVAGVNKNIQIIISDDGKNKFKIQYDSSGNSYSTPL